MPQPAGPYAERPRRSGKPEGRASLTARIWTSIAVMVELTVLPVQHCTPDPCRAPVCPAGCRGTCTRAASGADEGGCVRPVPGHHTMRSRRAAGARRRARLERAGWGRRGGWGGQWRTGRAGRAGGQCGRVGERGGRGGCTLSSKAWRRRCAHAAPLAYDAVCTPVHLLYQPRARP